MAGEQIRITPMGGVKAFSCRNCGGQINLLAPGQSLSAACKHCGAVADLMDENFEILSRHKDAITHQPRYEIGSIAQFEGHKWVLIGFMKRIVRVYEFEWEEYLLFNPYYGFRFLSHAYGHWSWIKMVNDGPLGQAETDRVRYQNTNYKFLNAGEAEVTFVLGEFYWQVKVGDTAQTRDLVAPPQMLSVEIEEGGMIWSRGEYLEPKQVEEAFGTAPNPKMARKGVGANQPNPYKALARWVTPTWFISVAVSLLILFTSWVAAPDKEALSADYAFPDSLDQVSEPFEIGRGTNNVEVVLTVQSGLDNHWVEFSGVLHSLETNENFEFVVGAEYYYGYTDGENWTEGGTVGETVLNEIPAGNYELVSSSASDSNGKVNLKIIRGTPIYTNIIGVLLLLSIVPIVVHTLSSNFEKKREA